MRTLLALALCAALPAHAQSPEAQATRAALAAAADTIAQGYDAFAEAADGLVSSTDRLCGAPGPETLAEARDAFAGAVRAWSRIETVRFGPVLSDNAAERIFFFPDRRGIGLRQVQAALASEDEGVTDPATLATRSVALQGLGTAEYLLHGTGAEALEEAGGAHRCAFAGAVADRVAATGGEVAEAWADPDGIAQRFAAPEPAYPDFQSRDDSLRALIGVFTNGIEGVRDARLAPYVAQGADTATPQGAAWTRSGLTADALAANVEGLERLFAGSEIDTLNADARGPLWDEIAFEFDNLGTLLAALAADPAPPADERDDIATAASFSMATLRATFGGRMAPALGQTAAFSVSDGD